MNKKELRAQQIAEAVGAGRAVSVPTVDFSDPNRPKTCLEVDFPILPVNEVATIEGNAGKPIYQMSKWWARRRSSVFRSMLIAAAMKAPDDPSTADKAVWDVYYANHQKKGAFKDLKVADIFMGGGTTIVEGSRLGMQMYGCDLNPVAWFIVKNEMADVDPVAVERLLADIEAEVKPQIMPFYACDCPRGHKGKWTRASTGEALGPGFDPLAATVEERRDLRYEGPEIIYVFWAKHGPCQTTGCGHRTPIMSTPVIAVKTISVRVWEGAACQKCGEACDVEENDVRMAPGVPLVVAPGERRFSHLGKAFRWQCPACGEANEKPVGKPGKRKVSLTLLVHPEWLHGSPAKAPDGAEFGGSVTDTPEATAAWNRERASRLRLVEVRGSLPEEVTCPETGVTFRTDEKGGTVRGPGQFACGACGVVHRIVRALEVSGKTAAISALLTHGYCSACDRDCTAYNGRFFRPPSRLDVFECADIEWTRRSQRDLAAYWPRSELPFGHMTHQRQPLPQHGYTHWWKMFNSRQLLAHAQLLKAITRAGSHSSEVRLYALGAFQQFLRNHSMFCFWNIQNDQLEPQFSNSNYHPKSGFIENSVFGERGRGNWRACSAALNETLDWRAAPWEFVSAHRIENDDAVAGPNPKVGCHDPTTRAAFIGVASATNLNAIAAGTLDLVITDPPFGGLVHYSELADFFYVWLRLALKDDYPGQFGPEYTPKTLEAVSNRAREPEDPDGFYRRILTQCWTEAYRILKPAGILAFTFHHKEDEPWVDVLRSLFDAGFYLEATYPIRSDEKKGDGEFGSKTIEYDIIHVCRKRLEEPKRVSWARMRREVLADVHQLAGILSHHEKAGLPAADLRVIQRGKALEYYSRHYGKVFVDEDRPMDVGAAIAGILQLLDEDAGVVKNPPPAVAEPHTRQLARIFDRLVSVPSDQVQKHLRGTGIAPAELVERGWCREERKVFHLAPPLEFAQAWHRRPRHKMTSDHDQAWFCIGACSEQSGIDMRATLQSEHFKPHPALAGLLDWHVEHGGSPAIRNAAARAAKILRAWEQENEAAVAAQREFLFAGEVAGA